MEKITRIIKEEFGLEGMNWVVSDMDIQEQSKWTDSATPFEQVVASVVHSFMRQMESSESPKDILSLEKELDLDNRDLMQQEMEKAIQKLVLSRKMTDHPLFRERRQFVI